MSFFPESFSMPIFWHLFPKSRSSGNKSDLIDYPLFQWSKVGFNFLGKQFVMCFFSLEIKENEHGSDVSLEYEMKDTYNRYKEFFLDVTAEMKKSGNIL